MNIFNYIKTRLAILDVVGEYVRLRQAGHYFKGSCPFHSEKTASFSVSPHKEIFYCFGCQAGGDLISFIARIENCSQIEAAQHLVERYNINLPDELVREAPEVAIADKKRHFEINGLVANWCHQQLLKSPSTLRYLLNRGLDQATITHFLIGYFPGGPLAIKQFLHDMRSASLMPHDLIDVGILLEGKNVLYSPFEERIIFPIKDHLARYCGFGGRVFKKDDERAKYYNSRENHYFAKGSLVFGLDAAKKAIQKSESVFLVEGYMDCIAMVQHGFTNTVATLGTACTLEHLKLLSRFANRLWVLYDGDNAGTQAVIRLTELCWQVSMELHVVRLPIGEDPASLLAKNIPIQPFIDASVDIVTFFIETVGEGFESKSLREKTQIARKLLDTIQRIEDPFTRDMLLDRTAKTLNMPFASLKSELERRTPTEPLPNNEQTLRHGFVAKKELEEENDDKNKLFDTPALEKQIFSAIINNNQLLKEEYEYYVFEYLPKPLSLILKKLKEIKEKDPKIQFVSFFNHLDEHQKQYVSKLVAEHETEMGASVFDQLIIQLQKKYWKTIVCDIKERIEFAKEKGDDKLVAHLVTEFLTLKKKLLPGNLIK